MKQFVADWREMVREQIDFRELLYQMTARDLILRYKQTVMGFAWAICMPLLNTAIFSVIFTRVAQVQTDVPYPVFAYCGFWAFNLTISALKFAVNSLTSNVSLVTKVYFPREIFPVAAVIVSLVDFAVAGIVMVGFMIYFRIPVGLPLIALPVVIVIQVVFTIAVALLLSMWNLFYRDVKYLFEVVSVMWMFATSVVYPAAAVTGRLGVLLQLNPMTPIIEAYRAILLKQQWPDTGPLVSVAVGSCLLLALAWHRFHRAEFQFAENI